MLKLTMNRLFIMACTASVTASAALPALAEAAYRGP